MGELKKKLREEIRQSFSYGSQMSDEDVADIIDEKILGRPMSLKDRLKLQKELFDSFRRLDILQELVDDPNITEIMVNGPNDIFVESGGRIGRWGGGTFESKEQLTNLIQQIVGQVNRIVNTSSPIVSARLENGSRVQVVLEPVAINGPILTIRKFPERITMERLIRYGSISVEAADFFKKVTAARYNIFVSGGTGAGKTTFLNALSEFIPRDERVITIEDSAELQLPHIENLVRLETRDANAEGEGAIGIGELIRASLRMRPDRIIIGEVRGKETVDLLQVLNTGHEGSFSSGHSNSVRDMLSRLETMVLMGMDLPLPAIRGQIASAIDIMVHVARQRDRSRKVVAIEEVAGIENGEIVLRPLFSLVDGHLERTGELKNREKLKLAGYQL
ncbi:MAG: CpaF family protein [Lachnospiraceae bacterium]|nr:CpaF family protein [Lachnospiraceae bacterium]